MASNNKHIKGFENHNQYIEYKGSTGTEYPLVSYCVSNIEVHYDTKKYSNQYLTFEALENGTFQFTNTINYSIDGGTTWVALAANTATPTITANNRIIWKAELTPSTSSPYGIGTFSSTGNFNVEGNPMSLLYGDNFVGQTDLTGKNYAFYRLFYNCSKLINAKNLSLLATILAISCYGIMFKNCTNLTTAPELPATTLASQCYQNMFYGCTSLTIAPSMLPATTLANNCYASMFKGCTSLTTAPELPATTLVNNCYSGMFQNCSSLTVAPELSATTLANNCYTSMFYGCTSLTTAPELPATTLANNCYSGMFQNCSSLTVAPELPVTTLKIYCYSYMFNGCTSLTTAPELPATTLVTRCYYQMFYNCTSLNYIKAMFTTTPDTSTTNWVGGVASKGTFVKNSAATWTTTGAGGVPTGWTVYKTTDTNLDNFKYKNIKYNELYKTVNINSTNSSELPNSKLKILMNNIGQNSYKIEQVIIPVNTTTFIQDASILSGISSTEISICIDENNHLNNVMLLRSDHSYNSFMEDENIVILNAKLVGIGTDNKIYSDVNIVNNSSNHIMYIYPELSITYWLNNGISELFLYVTFSNTEDR